jgi:hypothetical protein
MTPFWFSVRGADLAQGDLLPDCLVPTLPDDFGPSARPADITLRRGTLVVLTQTCDLANMKAGLVALCPVYGLGAFEAVNPQFTRKGAWEEVRKGRREGLHLLASPVRPEVSRDAVVVNFREIVSLPVGYLRTHADGLGDRFRLHPPFLEHFSQAFARFFMRVGLPSAVPPFPD